MKKKSDICHNIFSISVYITLIALVIMIITILEGEPDFNWFTVATISTVVMCLSSVFYNHYKEQEEKE